MSFFNFIKNLLPPPLTSRWRRAVPRREDESAGKAWRRAVKPMAFIALAALCYVLARLALFGLGERPTLTNSLTLAILLAFILPGRRTYLLLALPLSILVALYAPVGFEFGAPGFQFIISFYTTNPGEAADFLGMISIRSWLKAIAVPTLAWLIHDAAMRLSIRPWRNKTFILASVITLVVAVCPTRFVQNSTEGVKAALAEISRFRENCVRSAWPKSVRRAGPRDYVLVIGESARRDYFHVYGYPVANTPFLDRAPATIVDGLAAGGTYTIGSLRLMLTKGDVSRWEPDYSLTLPKLALSAGITTHWLSNQGFIGQWDTPVSSIAAQSEHVQFRNKLSYDVRNDSDRMLLGMLDNALAEADSGADRSNRSNLFVLHTLGSHPDACKRLFPEDAQAKVSEKRYEYVACYVSTIAKTDVFLKDVHARMLERRARTGRPFSILYFSDHGLLQRELDGRIHIDNGRPGKRHYDIPLVMIDSERPERRVLHSRKSGLRFVDGLANWMGVENARIEPYDLFDGKDDPEDHGLAKRIAEIELPDDPAIDITPWLVEPVERVFGE